MQSSSFETKMNRATSESPCLNCATRKYYARCFDFHFSGDDCPYNCMEYEFYKARKEMLELLEKKENEND